MLLLARRLIIFIIFDYLVFFIRDIWIIFLKTIHIHLEATLILHRRLFNVLICSEIKRLDINCLSFFSVSLAWSRFQSVRTLSSLHFVIFPIWKCTAEFIRKLINLHFKFLVILLFLSVWILFWKYFLFLDMLFREFNFIVEVSKLFQILRTPKPHIYLWKSFLHC